jgi:ribulose-phosphate 3-epimerase
MPDIYASLRSADQQSLGEELRRLEEAGVDGLHLDVMDGRFCEEVCFPLEEVVRIRHLTDLPLDVHLLVEDPGAELDEWIASGVQRLSFHLEAAPDAQPLLARVRSAGLAAGLVVLPGTPLESLDPWLGWVDQVNPLGVDPVARTGFDERTCSRIADLVTRREVRGLRFRIQADGGVWEKTRDALVRAGADELVGGYPIFSTNDYIKAVEELRHGRSDRT